MSFLFIHPRRGLFQLTKCKNCGFAFGCDHCDTNLVTYQAGINKLQLLCHQCQSYYEYPNYCPSCKSTQIISNFGGIDELVQILEQNFNKEVIRLDKKANSEKISSKAEQIYVTTRIFDPSINYANFAKIVFIHAENLLASPDYLVMEESIKSLSEIFLQVNEETEIIFDTTNPNSSFFQNLIKLASNNPEKEEIYSWYLQFLGKEAEIRQKYEFPPFKNLLLLTTQEKTAEKSLQILKSVQIYLNKTRQELPEISMGSIYPARFLKRKGMFSHHLLLKYPRNYKKFAQLQSIIQNLAELYRLQVRLNPKHLF